MQKSVFFYLFMSWYHKALEIYGSVSSPHHCINHLTTGEIYYLKSAWSKSPSAPRGTCPTEAAAQEKCLLPAGYLSQAGPSPPSMRAVAKASGSCWRTTESGSEHGRWWEAWWAMVYMKSQNMAFYKLLYPLCSVSIWRPFMSIKPIQELVAENLWRHFWRHEISSYTIPQIYN